MKPHPRPEAAQIAREIGDVRAVPVRLGVAEVHAIGRGVLADDQQLAHAALHQLLGLADDRMGGRDCSRPRMSGMMQNLHLWLQPSEILR